MTGKVTLVGAGPGGRELLTLAGAAAIEKADAVVFDRLVNEDILGLIPETAERVNVGKENNHHPVPQDQINEILVRLAKEGKNVVRLKGGDCYLFGRGGEECEYLLENGVPFQVIPGVTSALAAPAFAGIPVTHRDFCSSVHIITAHARAGKPLQIDFDSLVKAGGTLVFLMGLTALEQVMAGLLAAHIAPDMPAAVIENGTRGNQRKVVATVSDLAPQVRAAGLKSPALIIVGRVCTLSDRLDWFTPLPLHGKTVVVTRPRERAGTLAARLRELGANVIEAPCIETVERENVQPLADALAQRHDWAVFTSPAGVHAAVHALHKLGRDLRALYGMQLRGDRPRHSGRAGGLRLDRRPHPRAVRRRTPRGRAHGGPAAGRRGAAAARGSGRAHPARKAESRGRARHRRAAVRHRIPLRQGGRTRAMLEQGTADVVTFTSMSTVEGFVQAVGAADYSGFTALCIGEQTAQAARKYGMQVRVAQNATIDAMIDQLKMEN